MTDFDRVYLEVRSDGRWGLYNASGHPIGSVNGDLVFTRPTRLTVLPQGARQELRKVPCVQCGQPKWAWDIVIGDDQEPCPACRAGQP